LVVKGVRQEIHILFILTILAITVFFVHSLIRLFIMARGPRSTRSRNAIPSIVGPEGFNPPAPIRVHLARDEEVAAVEESKLEALKAPPPAYGLWRCSVVCLDYSLPWPFAIERVVFRKLILISYNSESIQIYSIGNGLKGPNTLRTATAGSVALPAALPKTRPAPTRDSHDQQSLSNVKPLKPIGHPAMLLTMGSITSFLRSPGTLFFFPRQRARFIPHIGIA
jgi:hypothetical protein